MERGKNAEEYEGKLKEGKKQKSILTGVACSSRHEKGGRCKDLLCGRREKGKGIGRLKATKKKQERRGQLGR